MQDKVIDIILKINKKYFFKKSHPFNSSKNWVLNLNYSDFEYDHAEGLFEMYSEIFETGLEIIPPPSGTPFGKGRLDSILKDKKILEVWCWAWWKLVYIAEKYQNPLPPLLGGNIIWIDINDNFLEQANEFARQKKVDKLVQFYKKSALDTGFEDDKFDIIIMSDVIEHIPETEKLLDEMYRVLKKDWIILFDFAPYYHYFGHHLWDTIQIPWIHVFFTDSFLIRLYKKSVEWLIDAEARVDLRISLRSVSRETGLKDIEVFDYLNKIKRKDFEDIVWRFLVKHNIKKSKINYYILKNMSFLSSIPFIREVAIKHIIWYIKK